MTPSLSKSKRAAPDPVTGKRASHPAPIQISARVHVPSTDHSSSALHTALRDLLRVHAPEAALLARVGGAVLHLQNDILELCGPELEPPEAWLESGEMTWLSRDGELLGLLWSDGGPEGRPVSPTATEVLTMLLAASRPDGAGREAEVLVTQLPVATAWLTPELVFRRVSRPFLELLDISDAGVLGHTVAEVLPGHPALLGALQGAVAGRSVHLPDALLSAKEADTAPRWVRGEARPYLGGWGAGVMVTLQDVSGEYERAARVSALLDTRTPAALLTEDGTVLHASPGLSELAPQMPGQPVPALIGAPLWDWPGFDGASVAAARDLVRLAAAGGEAQADLILAGGETLTLSVRHSAASGLLVAESVGVPVGGAAPLGLITQMLSLSEDATVLVDAAGRAQLINERAALLLGVEASRLVGLGLTRVLGELGVKVFSPDGQPLALPDWRTLPSPLCREVLLALPGHSLRHMELRVTPVGPEAGRRETGNRGNVQSGGLLLTLRDVTVLRRAEAKMHHDARHDALTGLHNRVGLREDLAALKKTELETAEVEAAENPVGALVCLNIDGFSALNTALGRVACDRLLIGLAARLSDVAGGKGGSAARLEGGTFAVLLPGLDIHDALEAVQRSLSVPLRCGPRETPLTFALGVAALDGTAEDSISNAEIAVRHARQQGRGGLGFYTPALRAGVRSAYALEEDLRGALTAREFTLLYQPVLGLKSGKPLGAESLLRWQHPELGLLLPHSFLEVAGRSELITHIGEWVVEEAVASRDRVRAECGETHPEWQVSVNLSLEELRRSEGLSRLLPLLSAQGAPDIEVAAGSLLDHSEETLDMLGQLRSHGARLSVDDFGDGAGSNLSALTRFPLDAIKLHPTLTARLPGDPRVVTLVASTIDLAHRLGLKVVAVGVERSEQLDILRELGCDAAQGYGVCPPLPETELLAWLAER
ncbi:EAL domain-containing protein [Deinococcus sp. AJ005]|uniref:sensor domain-containing protein n=1 Tax=Deinococcus sp. AJ005 TaxID=2652443 RepID=UPI001CF6899B|nr:EAL domain-containing protein [Deinococcus sp. AJ005]